jgi:hypothetical protein
MKLIKAVNLGLLVIAIGLLIFVTGSLDKITGAISYSFDQNPTKCTHAFGTELEIESCCFQVEQLIGCKKSSKNLYECKNSIDSENTFYLNQKAFNYCKKSGYDVKIS